MGISTVAAGLILENEILSLRETIIATGSIQIIAGLLWLILASPNEAKLISETNS
jgi:hypothetical protein